MKYYHFGVFDRGNAGDTIATEVTEDLIGEGCWDKYNAYFEHPPEDVIDYINNNVNAVVIGGGGLLHSGSMHGSQLASGWYCPLTVEQVERINRPIIVFGIGDSRFWGQEGFNKLFKPQINQLVRQSAFFGLRNSGSIGKLSKYLDSDLVEKLKLQPDPATILSYIYPLNKELRKNEIALQPALDAPCNRFGGRDEKILMSIAEAMKELKGFRIRLVLHIVRGNADYGMAKYLDKVGVEYDVVKLYGKSPQEIMDFYVDCPLTIGMRGHGVMIPFGVGNPFIPIISHNKVTFFLEDTGITRGIFIFDPDLKDRIVEAVNQINYKDFTERIEDIKYKLWVITQHNLKTIRTAIER